MDPVIHIAVRSIDKWIEQPEFNVLNVCLVEIDLLAYRVGDSSPVRLWIGKKPVVVKDWIVVIGSAFRRVESYVEDLLIEYSLRELSFWKYFLWVNCPDIMII